jgi:hypothetical protein
MLAAVLSVGTTLAATPAVRPTMAEYSIAGVTKSTKLEMTGQFITDGTSAREELVVIAIVNVGDKSGREAVRVTRQGTTSTFQLRTLISMSGYIEQDNAKTDARITLSTKADGEFTKIEFKRR